MIRKMFAALVVFTLLLALAVPAFAQDDDSNGDSEATEVTETSAETSDTETSDPETQDEAPEILSITPNPAVINGEGFITVTVEYADEDEDASRFVWRVLENDLLYYRIREGHFAQRIVGTEIPVRFYCYDAPYEADIELTIVDMAGNESTPETFSLICVEPDEASDETNRAVEG